MVADGARRLTDRARERAAGVDDRLRAALRAELPTTVFRRRPSRCLLLLPLLAVAAAGNIALLGRPPLHVAVPVALVLGNNYASLMFLTHEIGHGGVVRSRRLTFLLMYPGCAVFLMSPRLWLIWHNVSHHGHTNRPDQDPDSFGTLDNLSGRPLWYRRLVRAFPGLGRARTAAILLFTGFFTSQAQAVLWEKSRTLPGYRRLNRRAAALETGGLVVLWAGISVATGLFGMVFMVIVPMLVANFVILAYVATNHMLRPLRDRTDSLATTMSVRTFRALDRVHFHFSHHVEHHLFPALASSSLPLVRDALRRVDADAYLCPPHGRALRALFTTPRFYEGHDVLVHPSSLERRPLADVERQLRGRSR